MKQYSIIYDLQKGWKTLTFVGTLAEAKAYAQEMKAKLHLAPYKMYVMEVSNENNR